MASYKWHPGECKAPTTGISSATKFFELGMNCSSGHSMPIDLVAAHKWFNLAAAHGHGEGIRLRREIAEQMSASEVAAAQREARAWVIRH